MSWSHRPTAPLVQHSNLAQQINIRDEIPNIGTLIAVQKRIVISDIMTPSSDLHQLIKSLSGAEKRYFTLINSLHNKKGENIAYTLFQAIDEQKVYDETALIEQLKDTSIPQQLSSLKNKLFTQILKALQQYRANHASAETKALELLEQAKILLNKSMITLSIKYVNRAIKIAQKFDLTLIELEAHSLIRKIKYSRLTLGFVSELTDPQFVDREAELLKAYHERLNLLNAKDNMFRVQLQHLHLDHPSDDFLNLLPKRLEHPSKRNEILFCEMKALQGRIVKNASQHLNELIRAKELLLKSGLEKEDPFIFMGLQYNLIQAYYSFDMDKAYELSYELEDYIASLRKDKVQFITKFRGYIVVYSIRLAYYYDMVMPDKSIAQIEKFSGAFYDSLPESYSYVHSFEAIRAYFLKGEFRIALKYANRIINSEDQSIRQDINGISHLLAMLLHFEIKGTGELGFIIKATEKYLIKQKRYKAFEKKLIEFFKYAEKHHAFEPVPKAKFREHFDALRAEIEKGSDVYSTNKYYKFTLWFKSKYSGVDQITLNKEVPIDMSI